MIHPYDESYLDDVQRNIGVVFDLLLRIEKISPEEASAAFFNSEIAKNIEDGNPGYLAGRSGQDLASMIVGHRIDHDGLIEPGPEYWAGFVLADAQWRWFRPFEEILSGYPLERLLENYERLHVSSLEYVADEIRSAIKRNDLSAMRKRAGLSQHELAELSGVSLRSIRGYEQGTLSIGKAAGDSLYRLSRCLGCTIEDLLKG